MDVDFCIGFLKVYNRLSNNDIKAIDNFIETVEEGKINDLPGRNKNSNRVDARHPNYKALKDFATKYDLWHYHVGIPLYDKTNGAKDFTSQFVLHYRRFQDNIIIVKLDNHSPFALPSSTEMDIEETDKPVT